MLPDYLPSVGESNQEYEYQYKVVPTIGLKYFYPIVVTERNPQGSLRTIRADYDAQAQTYRCRDQRCL